MGVPVRVLAQGGGEVVAFPAAAEFGDDAPRLDGAGRERLFAEMAERQARLMFRVAHGLLRSVQDAEDAVQEALLKLYRGDAWLRMEDEKGFLARTVWRVGLDMVARRRSFVDDGGKELRQRADGGAEPGGAEREGPVAAAD